MFVDLPSLKTIRNVSGFPGSLSTVIESIDDQWFKFIWIDLPSLQSIEFGEYACAGMNDPCSSLIMRSLNEGIWIEMIDLPNLTSLTSEDGSFGNVCVVILESKNIYWRLID